MAQNEHRHSSYAIHTVPRVVRCQLKERNGGGGGGGGGDDDDDDDEEEEEEEMSFDGDRSYWL